MDKFGCTIDYSTPVFSGVFDKCAHIGIDCVERALVNSDRNSCIILQNIIFNDACLVVEEYFKRAQKVDKKLREQSIR